MFNVVIAPSGFKESLDAYQTADCIAKGVVRVLPSASIRKMPMMDGGEGFTKAMVDVTGGRLYSRVVTGPVGQPVASCFGFLGGQESQTAVIEMAAAAGLRLVPRDQRNPLLTTTYGVGELIGAALDKGARRILIGCGDSGTNDGGAGLAQALGAKLLDADGDPIARGGVGLATLAKIDLSRLDPRLRQVQIDVACNWQNFLCGTRGVARVFGPQKGGSPEMVEQLAHALEHYANIIQAQLGIDVREIPGGGASGGMGAGAAALLAGTLHPRYDIVMRYLNLDKLLKDADLVLTAEGSLDSQSPRGKVPTEVARRAKVHNVPVIALAGTLGQGVDENYKYGIDAFSCILPAPATLEQAIENAAEYLTAATERAIRQMMVGFRMASRQQMASLGAYPIS